ncbi:sulfonate transport system ATP-binding protein [Paraburkholderia bannensis]|uniref:Sulfonate transport system ATP-binding protein n=1 Tax=Paraburkholderia bannensis TaxID=765414 RepID=A0A7W9U2Y0_9BURK|nr:MULTISPECIES: ABC transporter ATP-binding protein [Paraburkholderia]MBB3261029.1 sulfonate transport system ATP-binding protein [Paraburkholderia sp. WP4_3_2]MBB6106066.1 sulfonate transport system ATP-binding protein [Paraburkholderia bannensis]
MNSPALAPHRGGALDSFVRLRGVSKRFQVAGDTRAILADLDLDIRREAFIAILGESGCGKSTLLRLLCGLDSAYDGQILVDGVAPKIGNDEAGIVFQDPRLFPWLTVEQNIALGLARFGLERAEVRQRVREHIALVGLAGFERALPHQLSGGMAQRVALARAIVARPAFLLLDEPFSALDALTRSQMHDQLLRIRAAADLTMLLVTHDVEEAVYLADRVVVMAPRPGPLRASVEIDLDYPRNRADTAFQRERERLHALLGHGAHSTHSTLSVHSHS